MSEQIPAEASGGTLQSPALITPDLLRGWPLPEPGGSKYSRGQVVVIGGAVTTPGAAMLAGVSALRMGAGRLSLAVPAGIAAHVAVAVPECGTVPLAQDEDGSVTGEGAVEQLAKEVGRADAVLVGPGLDEPEGSLRVVEAVADLLPDEVPVVLDAFGLTVLPDASAGSLRALAGRLVLTPNTGELARILGQDELDDEDVAPACIEAAEQYAATVGCGRWIAAQGAVWQVTTGDTGLGTSGSGDVVAGAAAGLLSRGAGVSQALVWSKYVHAAAGDTLAAQVGRIGYLAGEIPAQLSIVMRTLRGD